MTEYADALATPVSRALLGEVDLTAATEALLRELGARCRTGRWSAGPSRRPAGRCVRGLFVGGTLASEAALLAGERAQVTDFGDDAYTAGRAHPMIDPTLRLEHLARAAADPEVAVLLLDVVLGHGAEPDPAALLAPALAARRPAGGGDRGRHRRRPAGPGPGGRGAGRGGRRGAPVQRAARRAEPWSCSP